MGEEREKRSGRQTCNAKGRGALNASLNGVTDMAEVQQVMGRGELWRGHDTVLTGVSYRLEILADGSVEGQITAPPFGRLAPFVSAARDLPLLRIASSRFIAFEIKVYEPRPGGSAQIAGHLVRATVDLGSPVAA